MREELNYQVTDVRNLPRRYQEKYPSGSVLVIRRGEKIQKIKPFKNGSLLEEVEKINKKIKLTRHKAENILLRLEKER